MGTPDVNDYLEPNNAPITSGAPSINGYIFGYQNQRGAVSSMHLKNFSFNAGTGGTLTLGGLANGNGVMYVKDASGGTIVTVNNAGIEIDGGNILIKNASNTTIVDTSGIVSTASFRVDQIFSNSSNSTSGTIYSDIPGSSMTQFVLSRTATVLVSAFSTGYNIGRATDTSKYLKVLVTDSVNGNLIEYSHNGNWMISSIDFAGSAYSLDVAGDAVSIGAYLQLAAGTHTLKMQYKAVNGGTATIDAFILNYNILGS